LCFIAKDLKARSKVNRLLIKYADDSTAGANADADSEDESENVKQWAKDNRMIINFLKTKEIVFRRPNSRLFICPSPLSQIEQVKVTTLLGVILSES